jgi:hypothetical protein
MKIIMTTAVNIFRNSSGAITTGPLIYMELKQASVIKLLAKMNEP